MRDTDVPTPRQRTLPRAAARLLLPRSQALQARATYRFPINDGGKTTEVKALVEAQDQVKVPAGTFQTVRVVAEPTAGPLKGKGKVWVWFTDDANRTPVQMRAKLGWGTLLFRLQRVEK